MNQAKIQPTQMQATALQLYAETNLPTEFGTFRVMVFREAETEAEHMAIIKGDITASQDLPIRIHSECFTGEVLHSQKCDCREQLHAALEYISNQEAGMIIYLRQEGRGIGLGNKIRAYALQESGHDTVEANRLLGFGDDLRTYEVAAEILFHFKIGAVSLLTNNPLKIQALQNHGVQVNKRLPLICPTNQHSLSYFKTKQERMGHMFDVNADSQDQTDNGTVVATFPESSTK
jgi:GTP cyclohydrolase II